MASSSLVRRTLQSLGERLLQKDATVRIPHRVRTPEIKASPFALLPRGAYGQAYSFFSPDGGRSIFEIDGGRLVGDYTALAFISYWYVATRWRAQKIAEAPLMVVEEDQTTGSEEWLPDHELVDILDMPSPDYDMGELLECTSHYLDNTGSALWVLDKDRIGRIARITPFHRREFDIKSDATRIIATFTVQTKDGPRTFDAEEVCYFRDAGERGIEITRSRLDTAMSWLRLGAKAQSTVYDLLKNSVWPSAVIIPDKDWNPDPAVYEEYKMALEDYARHGNRGKPFVQLGGGTFNELASSIKNIMPEEILNRVESVVSAVSGVPAVVLQFQVGMENSPWSQMAQARRMAYDDTIIPAWSRIEKVLTRQMLRPIDEDTTHFLRFDTSNVSSLQADQLQQVQIASAMGRAATLNERRSVMGLEPATTKQDPDGRADDIPELTTPSLQDILAGNTNKNPNDSTDEGDNTDGEDDPEDAPPSESAANKAARRKTLEKKFATAALHRALRDEALDTWNLHIKQLLHADATRIAHLVESHLLDAKGLQAKSRGKDRVMSAVSGYLREEGRRAWAKTTTPLLVKAAERSTAVISSDLGVSYSLLHPSLLKFAQRNAGDLVSGVNKTTKSLVSDIIQGGLDSGATTKQIAQSIRDATGFSKSRAELIARTETTKAFNGAPEDSLTRLAADTGRVFVKTWSGVLDDRERDEHVALEGETVPVGEVFSNGLSYPSEPNCRCTILFDEVDA